MSAVDAEQARGVALRPLRAVEKVEEEPGVPEDHEEVGGGGRRWEEVGGGRLS